MGVYIGLDIGGTKFMVAAANEAGDVLARAMEPTPEDLEEGLQLLDSMILQVAGPKKLLGMGAAIGGPLDWQTGVVSPLHQPQWREVPLKTRMESRYHCPFWVDVDTNIAALGEYYLGRVQNNRLLYMTISTGIGGGFLMDGKIYRGFNGVHPEVGHHSIAYHCMNPEGLWCECGAPDCLEALVSGNGIRRIYGKPAEALNAEEWSEVAYNLGQGLRNIAAFYAPGVIVLGGGVAVGGGEKLLDQARRVMAANLRLVPAPAIQLSQLGYDTALMGALTASFRGIE